MAQPPLKYILLIKNQSFAQMTNIQQLQRPNQNQVKKMQEAAHAVSLHRQSKKILKAIADDLQIQDKLKKEEITTRLPEEVIKLIQNEIFTKPIEQIINENQLFRKYQVIADMLRKFSEINQIKKTFPSNSIQQQPIQRQLQPFQSLQSTQPLLMFQQQQLQNALPLLMRQAAQLGANLFDRSTYQPLSQQPMVPTSNMPMSFCPCKVNPSLRKNQDEIKCSNCDVRVHQGCLNVSFENDFECPNCIISKMDPLNEVHFQILQNQPLKKLSLPTMTGENSQNAGVTVLNFQLGPDDIKLIQYSSQLIKEQSLSIEIRSIRLDYKQIFETTWIDSGEILLNQVKLQEFNPLKSNSSLKKRKDEKLILKKIQLLCQGQNLVTIKECPIEEKQKMGFKLCEKSAIYLVQAFLVQRQTPQQLIEKIKIKKEIYQSKEESILQIQRQCKAQTVLENENEEVPLDNIQISLKCQFEMMMIETPARGKYCDHIQCFSLENTIKMISQVSPRKWKCPICRLRIFDINIDSYQLQILQNYRSQKLNIKQITLDNNGQFLCDEKDNLEEFLSDDSDQDVEVQNNSKNQQINNSINKENSELASKFIAVEDLNIQNVQLQSSQIEKQQIEQEGDRKEQENPIRPQSKQLLQQCLLQQQPSPQLDDNQFQLQLESLQALAKPELANLQPNNYLLPESIKKTPNEKQQIEIEQQQYEKKPSDNNLQLYPKQPNSSPSPLNQAYQQLYQQHLFTQNSPSLFQNFEEKDMIKSHLQMFNDIAQKSMLPNTQLMYLLQNNPQLIYQQQLLQLQQMNLQQQQQKQKNREKQELQGAEHYNFIQQFGNRNKIQLKEFVDQNTESLSKKIQNLMHNFKPFEIKVVITPIKFKKYKLIIEEEKQKLENEKNIELENNQKELNEIEKNIEPTEKMELEERQTKLNRLKDRLVRTLKKQFLEFIRKNATQLDNPIALQFNASRNQQRTKNAFYKLSQFDNNSAIVLLKCIFFSKYQLIAQLNEQLQKSIKPEPKQPPQSQFQIPQQQTSLNQLNSQVKQQQLYEQQQLLMQLHKNNQIEQSYSKLSTQQNQQLYLQNQQVATQQQQQIKQLQQQKFLKEQAENQQQLQQQQQQAAPQIISSSHNASPAVQQIAEQEQAAVVPSQQRVAGASDDPICIDD